MAYRFTLLPVTLVPETIGTARDGATIPELRRRLRDLAQQRLGPACQQRADSTLVGLYYVNPDTGDTVQVERT